MVQKEEHKQVRKQQNRDAVEARGILGVSIMRRCEVGAGKNVGWLCGVRSGVGGAMEEKLLFKYEFIWICQSMSFDSM
jgi:hypothetical protein